MLILALILLPALAGLAALLIRPDVPRRMLLLAAAAAHAALVAMAWQSAPLSCGELFELDELALLILSITSVLFFAAALYGVGYLHREKKAAKLDIEDGTLFSNTREAVFTACLLLFLSTMTLVAASQHLGVLWVAVEATTLASAPLIYFHRHHRSLEATWKYLLICSVGIAIALLGNFFLAAAARPASDAAAGSVGPAMTVRSLVEHAAQLNPVWLKAAFLLLLVGYGTKMGLAPLHTWLPDAHSEAPSMVSSLLSGALLNCAFLAVLRVYSICVKAGLADFCQELLIMFGLVSMGFAAVFIVAQADYKRMLAYSSVEHMGLLALGIGIGGAAAAGSLLHTINHSLTKAMLFLVAGNILAVYRTKSATDVRGLLKVLPVSGVLWVAGFLAITGSPPFGPFLSELKILQAAMERHVAAGVACLTMLAIIFVGMARIVLAMAYGQRLPTAAPTVEPPRRESLLAVVSPAVLGVAVLVLGLYVPPPLTAAINKALASLSLGMVP